MSLRLDLVARTLSERSDQRSVDGTSTCPNAREAPDGQRSLNLEPRQAQIIAQLSLGALHMPQAGVTQEWNALRTQISLIRKRLREAGFPPLIGREGVKYYLLHPVTVNGPLGIVVPGHMVAALRALLWSHPDHAGAEPFLVLL